MTQIVTRNKPNPQHSRKGTVVKRVILSAILALVVLAAAVQAQERASTTRLERQHAQVASMEKMEKNLPQMEASLLKTLDGDNTNMQAQAVQTFRDLEQMFPKYPFKSVLDPFEKKLKDETTDPIVRRLVALALDQLHSDAGDEVLAVVASSTQDKGLGLLCQALLVKSQYK